MNTSYEFNSKQYISTFEIKTFLVDVNEKIKKKKLKTFCTTQLNLNDYSLQKDDFLGTIFFEESMKYFIFTNKTYKDNKSFYFELLELIVKKYDYKYIAVLYSDVIYVFKDKKICFFQTLNFSLDKDEIKTLILEKVKIKVEEIVDINDEDIRKLNPKEKQKTKIKNLNESYRLNYFALLCLMLFTLLCIYSVFMFKKLEEKPAPLPIEYYSYKSEKLNNIINFFKESNIVIAKMNFSNKIKVNILINKNIYTKNLISKLNNKLTSIKTVYDQKTNSYKVEAYVK